MVCLKGWFNILYHKLPKSLTIREFKEIKFVGLCFYYQSYPIFSLPKGNLTGFNFELLLVPRLFDQVASALGCPDDSILVRYEALTQLEADGFQQCSTLGE